MSSLFFRLAALASLVLVPVAHGAADCTKFRREARVEALKDQEWVKATIARCEGRRGYLLHFDGLSASHDVWTLDLETIRLPAAQLEAERKGKELAEAAEKSGYKSNDYVYVQVGKDAEPVVVKLWSAGPANWSYMSAGVENRIELADIKGKWDPSTMKYKVGDQVRYVNGGFFPATITSIEAGGYKATITGGYSDVNVLRERNFVADWPYEEFEKLVAPLRELKRLYLQALMAYDAGKATTLELPKETAGVAEFQKAVTAWATADQAIKAKFPTLPALERPNCAYCPATIASVIARHKEILQRSMKLDPKQKIDEFMARLNVTEEAYTKDFGDPAIDALAARDASRAAKKALDKELSSFIAYGKVLGVEVKVDAPSLDGKISGYVKAFAKMVRTKPPVIASFDAEGTSFTAREPALEEAARAYIKENYPSSKCALTGTENHAWRPDGEGDYLVGRFKYVLWMCSDADYLYPFAMAVAVEQRHLGFGKYESTAWGSDALYSYYKK